jgi:hypothetical protein
MRIPAFGPIRGIDAMSILTISLFVASVLQQREAERAAESIHLAQYGAGVEQRAQHREIERVQPKSYLTPEEEAANLRARRDRLVLPEEIKGRP